LQARGIMQPHHAPETIGEMAADYLGIIRQTQPTGPYNLLGWSFGGLVAHAIATRLQDQGERVGLLALLDSYPIDADPQSPHDKDFDDGRFLADQLKAMGYYSSDKPLQLSSALSILRKEGDILSTLDEHQIYAIIRAFRHNSRLACNFRPQWFDGDVVLFAATGGAAPASADRWRPYVGGRIAVHEVDCEHIHMLRPAALAKIGPVLARALHQQQTAEQLTSRIESRAHRGRLPASRDGCQRGAKLDSSYPKNP
jgi:thioesterase domain-containing protein